jgi:TonB family protein
MNDLPLLVNGADNDPAAILLRSARSDYAPQDSKDRMRAMLGIVDAAEPVNGLPLPLPNHARQERAKRLRTIAKFIPFQNLIAPPKPASNPKFGAVIVATVQVAAIFAALFIRPLPRIEPVVEAPTAHRDEPEILFFAPNSARSDAANTPVTTQQSHPKAYALNKDGSGSPRLLQDAPLFNRLPPVESYVGGEQAGAFHQMEEPTSASAAPLKPESFGSRTTFATNPVAFQDGMTKPERIAGAEPVYPMTARQRGVEGTVVMRCVLSEQGLAQNCTILKSPAYLDDAVLAAADSWRFTPVKWQGRAVSVNYVFKYKFRLR